MIRWSTGCPSDSWRGEGGAERNLAQGQEQNYESHTLLHINKDGVMRESEGRTEYVREDGSKLGGERGGGSETKESNIKGEGKGGMIGELTCCVKKPSSSV